MIYSEVRNYLTQTTDYVIIDLFDRGVEALEKMGFEDYMNVFENVFGDNSGLGDTVVVDELNNALRVMMDSLLSMHGITMVITTTLSERIGMVDALSRIMEFDDKPAMMLALESDASDQEVFSTIVAMVSGQSIDNLMSQLEEVSDGLIGRMKELILQPEQEKMENVSEISQRIAEYGKFKIVFQNDKHWPDRFAKQSEAIGLPFDSYAALYMAGQVKQDLNDAENEDQGLRNVCVNLIGISCLSSDGSRCAQTNARRYLELIRPDMSQLTRLDMKFSSLLMEFNRAQT